MNHIAFTAQAIGSKNAHGVPIKQKWQYSGYMPVEPLPMRKLGKAMVAHTKLDLYIQRQHSGAYSCSFLSDSVFIN